MKVISLFQCNVLTRKPGLLIFMLMPLDVYHQPQHRYRSSPPSSGNGSAPPAGQCTPSLQKLLRDGLRNLRKRSMRQPGLQISQIWIWSCIREMCQNMSDPWRPHCGSDLALTCRGTDTGPLEGSCGAWHMDVSSGSFASWGLFWLISRHDNHINLNF